MKRTVVVASEMLLPQVPGVGGLEYKKGRDAHRLA